MLSYAAVMLDGRSRNTRSSERTSRESVEETKVEGRRFPMRPLCWMDGAEIPVRIESQGKE
jgi:hypothetical protein